MEIMKRRSQAAMEFLMTYGWAILVVMVALGALAYFGVLRPEQFLPEKCTISTGSGLFCSEFTTDAETNKIQLRVHNILNNDVTITEAKTDNPACIFSGAQLIKPDGREVIDLTGCTLEPRDKIKAAISIKYRIGDSPLLKGTSGTLTTIVP